jgi:hypothetical protein
MAMNAKEALTTLLGLVKDFFRASCNSSANPTLCCSSVVLVRVRGPQHVMLCGENYAHSTLLHLKLHFSATILLLGQVAHQHQKQILTTTQYLLRQLITIKLVQVFSKAC